MRLVFIHGWGFDASFWDALAALLPQFLQSRVDLGFFGEASDDVTSDEPSLLVGHSLGFVHGIKSGKKWAGWVAINSFPRFVAADKSAGCVPAAVVRSMRKRLMVDPAATLRDFYELIGAVPPVTTNAPHGERLRDGLDELREADISEDLARLNIPGLVLASLNDPLVPVETSAALHSNIHYDPSSGHMLPQTAAPWCAKAITDFLKERCGETP